MALLQVEWKGNIVQDVLKRRVGFVVNIGYVKKGSHNGALRAYGGIPKKAVLCYH